MTWHLGHEQAPPAFVPEPEFIGAPETGQAPSLLRRCGLSETIQIESQERGWLISIFYSSILSILPTPFGHLFLLYFPCLFTDLQRNARKRGLDKIAVIRTRSLPHPALG
jgi:hypothetical protein